MPVFKNKKLVKEGGNVQSYPMLSEGCSAHRRAHQLH
jgi:hypothetical protein